MVTWYNYQLNVVYLVNLPSEQYFILPSKLVGYFWEIDMTVVELMSRLQTKLDLEDVPFAKYLKTDPTTISKVRAGTLDLPMHSKYVLFDTTGFLVLAQALMCVLPKKAKEKAVQAIRERAFDMVQEALIQDLVTELHDQVIE